MPLRFILPLLCVFIPMTTPVLAQANFGSFDRRAQAGEALSVVFLGGSLTWGAQATDPQLTSYRALTSRKLAERYPQARFRFWGAAIGGTTSQLGAFRLERDVLARKPDLVFLDFTVNDDPSRGLRGHCRRAHVYPRSLNGAPRSVGQWLAFDELYLVFKYIAG